MDGPGESRTFPCMGVREKNPALPVWEIHYVSTCAGEGSGSQPSLQGIDAVPAQAIFVILAVGGHLPDALDAEYVRHAFAAVDGGDEAGEFWP